MESPLILDSDTIEKVRRIERVDSLITWRNWWLCRA
jgi:hypothetical protein